MTARKKKLSQNAAKSDVPPAPQLIDVGPDNIDREHLCCALGDPKHEQGVDRKKAWLRRRFEEGLRFKKFDVRGKVFIEYTPGEFAWRPVVAPGFLFIHCLWVSGRYQGHGYGKRLLRACIDEAEATKKAGVAVVTTKKKTSFVTNKSFFEKFGFEVVDTAPPNFELLALRLDRTAEPPRFHPNAKRIETASKPGAKRLRLIVTDQCPFTSYWAPQLAEAAEDYGVPAEMVRLTTRRQAKAARSAYGTFSMEVDGCRVSHSIPGTKELLKRLDRFDARSSS